MSQHTKDVLVMTSGGDVPSLKSSIEYAFNYFDLRLKLAT